jgi:hypothetical protein
MARVGEVIAMRIAGLIGSVVLTCALAACARHNEPTAAAPQAYSPSSGMIGAACPLAQLHAVRATVANVDHGVTITFTAPKREVDELRDDVRAMADANEKLGNAFAACPCGQMSAATGVTEAMPSPAADSSVSDVDTGAVLKLTAKKESQVDALRSAIRDDVKALRKSCLEQEHPHHGP